MIKLAILLAIAAIAQSGWATDLTARNDAASPVAAVTAGVDPLAADIDARDALRFAQLMKDDSVPTADVLQRGYLDKNKSPAIPASKLLKISALGLVMLKLR